MSSGKKKFRIELEDAEGSKYNLSLEGNISKEKVLKIVEFMDLLNIESPNGTSTAPKDSGLSGSVGDRMWSLVSGNFPYGSFTSSDILELYEDRYNEPIKLSIVSTYLSRYAERGRLSRIRQGKEWVYRAARDSAPQMPPQPSPSASDDQAL